MMNILIIFLAIRCGLAIGEEIRLTDGGTHKGRIVSYSDHDIIIDTEKGMVSLPKKSVALVVVNPQKPDRRFSTPEGTISFWVQSARKADVENMVRCYISYSQIQKRKELLAIKKKELLRMKNDAIKTVFDISEPLVIDDRATIKVGRELGSASESELFELALERGEWKIVP